MEVKTLDLGPHPTELGKAFENMDWKATAIAVKNGGVPNYKKKNSTSFTTTFMRLETTRENLQKLQQPPGITVHSSEPIRRRPIGLGLVDSALSIDEYSFLLP